MTRLPVVLLDWYKQYRRDLPWRRTRDPYSIWVSEIMLQQTQVKTALPYYEAFLTRFPTVDVLASAHLDEVLANWSGLGYYRRARQMHQAACEIVAQGEGFPRNYQGLLQLPGVGPYTAAAVASIAFSEVVPVLDGNVERVLSRYLALEEDPKRRKTRAVLLAKAAEFLDPRCPGESNQALMELGATVCSPRGPKCGSCPLQESCRGWGNGDPERYPPPKRRRQVEKVSWSVALAERRKRVLFFRRPNTCEVLPGMWEIPSVPHAGDKASLELALAESYGGNWTLEGECFQVRHSITYRSITLHVHPVRLVGPVDKGHETAWISPSDRGDYGLSSMFEKVLKRWDLGVS